MAPVQNALPSIASAQPQVAERDVPAGGQKRGSAKRPAIARSPLTRVGRPRLHATPQPPQVSALVDVLARLPRHFVAPPSHPSAVAPSGAAAHPATTPTTPRSTVRRQ
jgi:hypothetical protein